MPNSFFSFAKFINSNKTSINAKIAKPIFIVNGDKEILIEKYGSVNDYNFSVKNYNDNNNTSEVSLNYKIEIIANENIKYQLFCNDNLVNVNNIFTLPHSNPKEDNYTLKIEAPEDYKGSVKINSVPTPSVLITLMFSLWDWIISFVMESPNPVPFLSFPRERSVL